MTVARAAFAAGEGAGVAGWLRGPMWVGVSEEARRVAAAKVAAARVAAAKVAAAEVAAAEGAAAVVVAREAEAVEVGRAAMVAVMVAGRAAAGTAPDQRRPPQPGVCPRARTSGLQS